MSGGGQSAMTPKDYMQAQSALKISQQNSGTTKNLRELKRNASLRNKKFSMPLVLSARQTLRLGVGNKRKLSQKLNILSSPADEIPKSPRTPRPKLSSNGKSGKSTFS